MVFGVFDGLHDGHLSFLNQAQALGERLIVVVARDESVMRLKHHLPQRSCSERINALIQSELAQEIIPGDETEGGWEVIHKYRPDLVALGYDQHAMQIHLLNALPAFPFPCRATVLAPYRPDECHSSLLNACRVETQNVTP